MSLLLTAFLMGLLGVGHCVSMCGSLSMALGFSIPANKSYIRYASIISLARIFGYALIGFIANFFTQSIFTITHGNILYLSIFASILMLGIGLHVAQISNAILNIEWLGKYINRVIEPLKKRILPIDSILKCVAYGILWGFLPCGLIYTALSLAVVAPSQINAALIMFCFGLGTLPAVVGMTAFNSKISIYLKNANIRLFFGLVIIIMAVYQLYVTYHKLTGID